MDREPESMRVRQPTKGRGRGGRRATSRPAASTSRTTPGSSRVTSKNTRGRGQARGGGRGGKSGNRGRQAGGAAGAGPSGHGPPDQPSDDDEAEAAALQMVNVMEFQNNEVSLGFIALNKEPELPGFDKTAGDIWIYPTNKPVRDYQFNIVHTALFNNTLVSLPTGLGKTFIAAVVMFNFSRWYPDCIMVFMAPTKPLVTQQLDACHNLMGIPPSRMFELTGQIPPKKREEIWKERNVLFLTPQVMMSDLERGYCPADKVRLVVVDEAHRSQGNYSYVQVISKLIQIHKCFRILALSATPGNDTAAVQDVFKNLLISRVELRSDSSPDILPYTRQKEVETIVVKLDGNVKKFHDKILEVFQHYSGKLQQQSALSSRGGTFTQFQLLKARQTFRTDNKVPAFRKGLTELDFATAITLAHSLELINIHGLRTFYSFLHGVIRKEKGHGQVTSELKRNTNVEAILEELRTFLKISSDNSTIKLNATGFLTLDEGVEGDDATNVTGGEDVDYFISHPKFHALREIVKKHFETFAGTNQSTRVMIFSQYRDSVQEIGSMLSTLRPLVKPMVFVGQSSSAAVGRGLKQKEQAQVVQRFREGGYNVLVSTSVGEEGLDIGEVDLIVCFDCNKSPTRLIQRMGRTGRQRHGRTVFLLTSGKEESMYRASVYQSTTINKNILDTSNFDAYLYKETPRMIPLGLQPQCYKMDIILSSEQGQISKIAQARTSIGPTTSKESNKKINVRDVPKNNTPELTLTQCFNRGGDVMKKLNKVAESPAKPEIVPIPLPIPADEDEDCTTAGEFFQNLPTEAHGTGWSDSDYKKLCKIFEIPDVNATVTHCVRVPKLPAAAFEWSDDFNRLPVDDVVLKGKELDFVLEEADAEMLMGERPTHCGCGLEYLDENKLFEFGDDEFDPEFQSNIINDPVNQDQNSVASGAARFSDWSNNDGGLDFGEAVQGRQGAEKLQNKSNMEQPDEDDPPGQFNITDFPDFDVGFLLDNDQELDIDAAKSIDNGNENGEAPLSPIFSTRKSAFAKSQDKRIPENLPKLPDNINERIPGFSSPQYENAKRDEEEDLMVVSYHQEENIGNQSPVFKPEQYENVGYQSPEFKPQQYENLGRSSVHNSGDRHDQYTANGSPTFKSQHAHNSHPELSPIITSQRLRGDIFRTPEKNSEGESEKFAGSPVFVRTIFEGDNDNFPTSGSLFCASTPMKNKEVKGSITKQDDHAPEPDHQDSDSEEVIPASPERNSVPVPVKTDAPEVHIFKVPTPMRKFINRVPPPSTKVDNSSAANVGALSQSIWPSSATQNPSKKKFVFKEKIPKVIAPQRNTQLPSASLAAALRKTPASLVPNTSACSFNRTLNELEVLANSQKHNINPPPPAPADDSLIISSLSRNQPSAPIGGWTKVDRPEPKSSLAFVSKPFSSRPPSAKQGPSKVVKFANVSMEEDDEPRARPKPKKRKRRIKKTNNPFLEDEASVSGDETSSGDEDASNSELDELDNSFVEDVNVSVTESQQIRYLKSTRDVPTNAGRVERPLEPQFHNTLVDITEVDYESDSFCVAGDEVDYVEVGNFTQAMIKAQDQVEKEMGNGQRKRKARIESSSSESPTSEPRNPPPAVGRMNLRSKKRLLFSPEPEPKPRRKRIIEYTSDDDSDANG